MTLEGALRTVLLADETVSAAVGDRIVPLLAGPQPSNPHLTYVVDDGEDPAPTFDGPSGILVTEIEYFVVDETYDGVLSLSQNVRRILDGHFGSTGDMRIVPCRYVSQTDIEQGTRPGESTPVYMRSMRFKATSMAAV